MENVKVLLPYEGNVNEAKEAYNLEARISRISSCGIQDTEFIGTKENILRLLDEFGGLENIQACGMEEPFGVLYNAETNEKIN